MKRFLIILCCFILSIGIAYADDNYNGDQNEGGGGSQDSGVAGGASYTQSGLRMYIVDSNGYTVTPDAVDVLYQSKPAGLKEFNSIKIKDKTIGIRTYADRSIPTPFYYDGEFQTNGEAIRNYMLTQTAEGDTNAHLLIEKYWGADIARRFSQEDWYFCIEPIAWMGVYNENGYTNNSFYGTATEWAKLMKSLGTEEYHQTLRNVANKTVHDVIDGRTKKDSNRTLELSDEAEAIICETLRLQEKDGIQSEYLFADEKGNNIIRQRINDCLRYYCKQISVDVKSSHKIRKTVLSNLFAKDFNIDEVMKIAGHRDKLTTYKYYLFSVNLKEKKKERLNEALGSKHCTLGQPKVNPIKTA